MKKVTRLLLAVAAFALLAGQVSAKVININWNRYGVEGVNIVTNAPGQGVLDDSGTAGVWNNVGGSTGPQNLLDSDGNVTSVDVAMGFAGKYSGSNVLTPVNDYIYTFDANINTFTFSGLDVGQTYEVAFLGHGNKLNVTILTMGGVSKTNAPTDASKAVWVEGENYNTFTFTADTSGKATGTWSGDGRSGAIGALQIKAIPEPAALGAPQREAIPEPVKIGAPQREAIPEPVKIGLFALLGVALLFVRRRSEA